MIRRSQQKNNLTDVLITANDILYPPHGQAPSRAAVIALQHWANFPQQFYKELLGEQIKHIEDGETSKVNKDMVLEDVKRLLQQITSRKGGACSTD